MVQIINTVDSHEVDRENASPVNKAENRSLYASREAIPTSLSYHFLLPK